MEECARLARAGKQAAESGVGCSLGQLLLGAKLVLMASGKPPRIAPQWAMGPEESERGGKVRDTLNAPWKGPGSGSWNGKGGRDRVCVCRNGVAQGGRQGRRDRSRD